MMFKKYRRTNIAEMRPYIEGEMLPDFVSISATDLKKGSPKPGDMIARNPAIHDDQWLVAADYFAANFEPYDEATTDTQAEIERLREALQIAGKRCNDVHHPRGMQHSTDQPCPVEALIEAALTNNSGEQ